MLKKIALSLTLCTAAAILPADIRLYPDRGGLNLRVPPVPTAPGGAKGKAVPFEQVSFSYRLAPHLTPQDRGELRFFLRRSPRRNEMTLVALRDNHGRELRLGITAAAKGRRLQLTFTPGKAVATCAAQLPAGSWREARLSWDRGRAAFQVAGQNTELTIPTDFRPEELTCLAWAVDELILNSTGGTFRLDWEKDYAATVMPGGSGGVTARDFGFDTFVIGTDPARRDFPLLQLCNSTATPRKCEITYRITGENTGLERTWTEPQTVPAGTGTMIPIKFPFPLQTDIYHLKIQVSGTDRPVEIKRHFMYVEPSREQPGPGLFGLHDCDVKDFGFWPDALALRYAHKYLRWGYVVGPAWVRDWNGGYGLDPDTPVEEWTWNARLDWELAAGRELYVCLESYPYGNWYRARDYAGMKKYPWGYGGGFPKLDYYEKFVRAAARRYHGKIKHWEVENEPNATGHMPNHPEDYAAIAATVRRAVKASDPDALIYGICGTSTFVPWMKKTLAAGADRALDVISWHTYTTPEQPDRAGLMEMLADARRAVPHGKPVFNSETGVLCVLRREAEKPLSPEEVAARIKAGETGFASRSAWPGRVNDEWQAASSIVKNAVINFLSGAQGFVFFGWNPEWPKHPRKWTNQPPSFSMLSADVNGERTPSLFSLAAGVLTAQMAGVDLHKPYRAVKAGAVQGGIFTTVAEGETAVLWATTPRTTALIRTTGGELRTVSAFGREKVLAGGMIPLELGTMPVYLHYRGKGLEILPSPVEKTVVKDISGGSGKVTFTLLNRDSRDWNAVITPLTATGLAVAPARTAITIPAKRRKLAEFTCRPTDKTAAEEYWVPFSISLPSGGSYTTSVHMANRPTVTPLQLPDNLAVPTPEAMAAAGSPLPLDRAEQAVVGRPTKLASLQEDYFWGGRDELSAQVWIGSNRDGLTVTVKVRDAHPRLPVRWPDVRGASLELFFDFRAPDAGLGSAYYGEKVYQFLVLPALTADVAPKVWSSQLTDPAAAGVKVYGAPLGSRDYWIGLRIPWRLVRGKDGAAPKQFGFDVGVNGSYPDRTERKTQLMLFGTERNFRDASRFGAAVIK